jgi:phospholipase C
MAASIDPTGQNGGPILQTLVLNRSSLFRKLTYTTMPEQLQAGGISWKVYTSPDQNILNSIFSDSCSERRAAGPLRTTSPGDQ